jgi:antitoxin component YwqK of YwqJK toxin-antitoxin module
MDTLNIAEIPYETGELKFRYSRYMSADKTKWIRHGLFCQYYKNGNIASEGEYEHGLENGLWKDYHENGIKASEGHYKNGKQTGIWNYWDKEGKVEVSETF